MQMWIHHTCEYALVVFVAILNDAIPQNIAFICTLSLGKLWHHGTDYIY